MSCSAVATRPVREERLLPTYFLPYLLCPQVAHDPEAALPRSRHASLQAPICCELSRDRRKFGAEQLLNVANDAAAVDHARGERGARTGACD